MIPWTRVNLASQLLVWPCGIGIFYCVSGSFDARWQLLSTVGYLYMYGHSEIKAFGYRAGRPPTVTTTISTGRQFPNNVSARYSHK